MELKELIDLQHFQLRDEPTGDNEKKKVLFLSAFFSVFQSYPVSFGICVIYFVCVCSGHIPSC